MPLESLIFRRGELFKGMLTKKGLLGKTFTKQFAPSFSPTAERFGVFDQIGSGMVRSITGPRVTEKPTILRTFHVMLMRTFGWHIPRAEEACSHADRTLRKPLQMNKGLLARQGFRLEWETLY